MSEKTHQFARITDLEITKCKDTLYPNLAQKCSYRNFYMEVEVYSDPTLSSF